MKETLIKTISQGEVVSARRDPLDRETLAAAQKIVDDVRERGETALREHAERLGDIEPGGPFVISREDLSKARDSIASTDVELLERTAERIRVFAKAQMDSLKRMEIPVPGGAAGQDVAPVERAGCYAPGGRFPLPSSVLMTAVTSTAAGVKETWVASPKPEPITLAAAAVAGVDGFLAVGGAQGIAALAYGVGPVPACDVVVGPGNKFVTAAKKLVFGRVAIDMLAGPSELAVLADATANPATVAADLLAQAEHDPDAVPALVALDDQIIVDVNVELWKQLADLPTAETARAALRNGFAVLAPNLDNAIEICDRIAPEHLEIQTENAKEVAGRCLHYGAIFIGTSAAEVLGDYGAGPNHTLPTGGTARYSGGLSVFDFLRVRTWLDIDDRAAARELVQDAERLAELEGLAAHARSAAKRQTT
ncbi:MAG: histidinol dehydrogenase [Deltaproteobacteria bacterium]|nr:histidinol dehydrogenase [Deltaproteobacteria bacterium]